MNAPIWSLTGCTDCALSQSAQQVVIATPLENGILAIGEAPGAQEDQEGQGFVGSAGKSLDRLLKDVGIARHQYGRANICRCRPPENRKPTAQEIQSCSKYLIDLILQTRPKVILCVGLTPTEFFLGKASLGAHIESARQHGHEVKKLLESKGPASQAALVSIKDTTQYLVPCPHSSPLALNRYTPSGVSWRAVAQEQVKTAQALLLGQSPLG